MNPDPGLCTWQTSRPVDEFKGRKSKNKMMGGILGGVPCPPLQSSGVDEVVTTVGQRGSFVTSSVHTREVRTG